jgi:hypothetical protein
MTPFWRLTEHFVKRLVASEEEEGTESVSLGLGMVLAILASPGAFASIFLMDKYSTLLQWLRGQRHFNPFKASAADEYFFIVLSMTITGLVMVLRWNRLFPDRRDFQNLAVLPLPIRHVFLANFTALAGLALVFAIDVNLCSSFLFPVFVTMSDNRLSAFFAVASAHAAAVFSASLFSFFTVFALVGLLMLLPVGWFRPVSVALRLLLVVGLLTEFFANLFLQLFSGRLPVQAAAYAHLLPSFWFLGLYENLLHTAGPAMALLGRRALLSLALSLLLALAAYTLCYRRHFLRLAESFDNLGATRHAPLFPFPRPLRCLLFRSSFEEACGRFALQVLSRSERHVMLCGGYLGVGLVIVAQNALDQRWLELPLLVTFFLITGLRLSFDTPATLTANWLFRLAPDYPQPSAQDMARRFLRLSVLPGLCLLAPPFLATHAGWIPALELTAFDCAFALLGIELLLVNFHKLAFTYAARSDMPQIILRILGALFIVGGVIPLIATVEQWSLSGVWRPALLSGLLSAAFFELDRRRRALPPQDQRLVFEEKPGSSFELLKLA